MKADKKKLVIESDRYGGLLTNQMQYLLISMLVLTAWTLTLYADTFLSMVRVWVASRTYNHGIFILPISAFVIWQRRHELAALESRPSAYGLVVLVAAIIFWFLARLATIRIGEHFGLIAIICSGFWSVFGTASVKVIRFPLLFAFFAVPFGDFLIPALMVWTANFVVWALTITGVPVYIEGFYFWLPSGTFEVIEACSGIRFLIVTIVLAIFFAYERFESSIRRAVFVLAAALSIIVANGIRAYLVVLIAHLSEMKYGTGQDHLYLGWAVFLLSITTIFWIGARFSDRSTAKLSSAIDRQENRDSAVFVSPRRKVIWFAITLTVVCLGPALVRYDSGRVPPVLSIPTLPYAANDWEGPDAARLAYAPVTSGADVEVSAEYRASGGDVGVYFAFFAEQRHGKELIRTDNHVFDKSNWHLIERTKSRVVEVDGEHLPVRQALITDGGSHVLLWYWYDVGRRRTTSKTAAKFFHMLDASFGKSEGDALVVISTGVPDQRQNRMALAVSRLQGFLHDHYSSLDLCMRPPGQRPHICAAESSEI